MPKIQRFCPNCKNEFKSLYLDRFYDEVIMYEKMYTDGYNVMKYGITDGVGIVKCPKCKKYFDTLYLIKVEEEDTPWWLSNKEEEKKEWERQKSLPEISPIKCLHTPKFWTKIIEQGLFYPQTATKKNKKENLRILYVMLWRSCNHCKNKNFSKEFYDNVVDKLLELCDLGKGAPKYPVLVDGKVKGAYFMGEEEDILIRAEIYRNRGEFEKAQEEVDKIYDETAIRNGLIDKMKKLIQQKKKETCEITRAID